MAEGTEGFVQKVSLLKEARLQLLQLHKMLVDLERSGYEEVHGKISSGGFLNLLISDDDFAWLRKFSALIVRIDEMFDLDDGYHEGFVDKHLEAVRTLVFLESDDDEFNARFRDAIQMFEAVEEKRNVIKRLLAG